MIFSKGIEKSESRNKARLNTLVCPTPRGNCNARTTCTNSSGVKPDFGLDQDQKCNINYKLKLKG